MIHDDVILKAENITKRFPGVVALNNAKFELRKGDVHALCGEKGAGKSTFLKIITGLYRNDEGKIYIDNQKVEINSITDARKYGIYVVPQEVQIAPDPSIAENIFIGNYPTKKMGLIDWKAMYSRANELKKILEINEASFNVRLKVENLSMGYKQIIEIMRSMISERIRIPAFDE
jgi:ABC-type sugar transport system ATPase subunit